MDNSIDRDCCFLVWSVDLHWLLQRTYLGAVHDGIPLVFWEPWNTFGHQRGVLWQTGRYDISTQ